MMSSKLKKWILLPKENIFDTLTVLIRLIEKKIEVLENQDFRQNGSQNPLRHVRQLFILTEKKQEVAT